MDLVIATGNLNKVREIKQIFADKFENIFSAKELGLSIDVEETGSSFYENALIKAQFVKSQTSMAVLSDDSGLCVDCLDGAPGVYSNRYFKEGDDKANREHLLNVLVDKTNRNAHFESCVVLINQDGKIFSATGKAFGKILTEEQGESGFGYDCIFYSNDLKMSFGSASSKEKNSVSHRAIALKELLKKL